MRLTNPMHLIERPRLTDHIAHRATFTIICGPEGAGKRTLLDSWRRTSLGRAAQVIDIGTATRVEAAPRDGLWSRICDTMHLCAANREDVRELAMSGLFGCNHPVLVITDPMMAGDDAVCDQLLDLTLRVPHVKVVLVTTERATTFERIAQESPTLFIGEENLGFSTAEVATLAAGMGALMHPEDADAIRSQFAGHPGLIVQCVQHAARGERDDWARAIEATASDDVQALLASASAEFAIRLALCGRVGVAELALLDPAGELHLSRAVAQGRCLVRRERDGSAIYEWCPAVRAALLTDPRAPRIAARLIARTAEHDRHDLAFRIAVTTRQWSVVVSVIERSLPLLVANANRDLVAAVRDVPTLIAGESLRVLGLQELVGMPVRVPDAMIPVVPAGNRMLAELSGDSSAESLMTDIQLCIALMRNRGDRARERWLVRALCALSSNVDVGAGGRLDAVVKRSWFCVALTLLIDERSAEARAYLRMIVDGLDKPGESGELALAAQWLIAVSLLLDADYVAGRAAVERARQVSPNSTYRWSFGLAEIADGLIAYHEGRLADSSIGLRRAPHRWYDLYSTGVALYVQVKITGELPAEWGLDRVLLRTAARRGYRQGTGRLLPILLSAAMLERAVQRGDISQARRIWRCSHYGVRNSLAMARIESADGGAEKARRMLVALAESANLTEALRSDLNEQMRRLDQRSISRTSWRELVPTARSNGQTSGNIDRVQRLSHTEREVLSEIDGRTIGEVAQQRFVSRNTIKSQLRSAYRKLGVNTKDEALRVMQSAAPHRR
ncbi:helix-turn-helix transcriptional regulator [Cumulibacter soli]|uniref:helix-turn-helix transcriptional regulator n=1 Tax=Cumulibacter soli TaxID=2546344 RepID=UPI001068AAF1|nr:LuxR family transcriptional regulator [Cumulibacter soli]